MAEIADPADERARQIERTCRVLLGDVMSLGSDVDAANAAYEAALTTATKPDEVAFIRNKLHRIGYAQRDGARIAYYEHGSGSPTIVFVNPLVYGLGTFQPIIERLCQEFRVITIDCRGAGRSDPLIRPYTIEQHSLDLCSVIEAAGAAPVIGVGISRGGNQWLRLAYHRPELVQGAMLVASPIGTPTEDLGDYFNSDYRRRRNDLRRQGEVLDLVRLQLEYILTEPHIEGVRQAFFDAISRLPTETILSFFDDDPTADVSALLPEVRVPILVTHGREDRLLKWEAAEAIARAIPGAGLHFFEGRGHLATFTATAEFCDVLIRFVRGENFSVP